MIDCGAVGEGGAIHAEPEMSTTCGSTAMFAQRLRLAPAEP